MVLSTIGQAVAVTAVFAVPALFFADRLPEIPTMMAFVASPPPPFHRRQPPRRCRVPVKFVLTVTLSFRLEEKKG